MKDTIRIIAASAFVTALLIKAAPAAAEPVSERTATIVRTADLDLSSRAGVRELHQRVDAAARQVCGLASDADLVGKNEVRRCRHEVVAQAAAKADQLIASRRVGTSIALAAR